MFEIAKTASGYANTPTTLSSFDNPEGLGPDAGLIADANGDLFGTTESGGANFHGTVFEIAKSATGYASVPTTLVSFDLADGTARKDVWSPTPRAISSAQPNLKAARIATERCSRSPRPRPATPAPPLLWSASTLPTGRSRLGAWLPTPTAISLAPRREAVCPVSCSRPASRMAKARCSRSPRPPPVTPARRPPWSTSIFLRAQLVRTGA